MSKNFKLVTTLLMLACPVAGADLSVSGFGTLGVLTTDSEESRFRTDMSQDKGAEKDRLGFSPLSKLGVQFDYVFSDEWDVVGQFVYRQQDRQNLDSITSLAFLRYKPNANWQVRAGRIFPNIFQQSEVRDIGIAYMWTKVPTEVYGPVPVRNLDGAELSYDDQLGSLFFHGSIFTGVTKSDFTSNDYLPIEFEDLIGVSAKLESFNWKATARYVQAKFANSVKTYEDIVAGIQQAQPVWPNSLNFAADFNFIGKQINYSSFYGEYSFDSWDVSGELTYFKSNSLVINGTTAGYLNVAYPYNNHTFYATYSFADSKEYEFNEVILMPEAVEDLIFFTKEGLSIFNLNQESISVGWRYDISSQLAVKFQFENSKIEQGSGGLRIDNGFRFLTPSSRTNTIFATLDFSF